MNRSLAALNNGGDSPAFPNGKKNNERKPFTHYKSSDHAYNPVVRFAMETCI